VNRAQIYSGITSDMLEPKKKLSVGNRSCPSLHKAFKAGLNNKHSVENQGFHIVIRQFVECMRIA
jgi:hypothetical protein